MKRITKPSLTGLAIATLSVGLAACAPMPSNASALPEGCAYEDILLHCEGVDLAEILSSKDASSLTALSMSGGLIGEEASLAGLDDLENLFIANPVDPESIARVANTAPSLGKLAISAPVPADMNVEVPAVIIGLIGDGAGAALTDSAPVQKIDPKFSPTSIVSAKLYELSAPSAAKVEELGIMSLVEGESIDLTGYTSLKNLNVTVTKGAEMKLPQHIIDSDKLRVITDSSGAKYEF